MSRSKNHNNSVELSTAMAGEDNPYLHSVANEEPKPQTDGGSDQNEEAQQEAALQRAEEEKKRKRRRHRWFALAFIFTLLSASVGLAVVLYLRQSTRVTYGQAAHQPGVLPPPPNGSGNTTRNSGHEQALQALERLNAAGHAPVLERRIPSQNDASQNVTTTTPEFQQPFTLPDSSPATNDAGSSDKNLSTSSSTPAEPRAIRSQRNSETSLYAGNRIEGNQPTARSSERSLLKQSSPKAANTEVTVVAPPFGSILPVRAIGGLYTLRTGALARFELTRDMTGTGWSMKRGTILVGTTKGGEYDRAYVSIIGFVDPKSSKLVKLGGDVLGGDGAAGLKGKSRQVDSRWTRMLGQIGNAALNLTGALLGGRSNGTVIISDGAGSPLMNPISDELSGVIGSPSDRNRRSQFVEVVAGTPGYVIVTDLPAEMMPANANELNQQTMASLADIDATRPATGISEREFADLLANGSSDEIKARLHRMSPEMRKIALAVMER